MVAIACCRGGIYIYTYIYIYIYIGLPPRSPGGAHGEGPGGGLPAGPPPVPGDGCQVWEIPLSGGEAQDRKKVGEEDRVKLIAKGDGVHTNAFGGEGTGGHSHLVYPWKTGETQKFLVTAHPDDATHTTYSGFYFHPDEKQWTLISSWRAPKEGGYMRRPRTEIGNERGVPRNGLLLPQGNMGLCFSCRLFWRPCLQTIILS